MNARIHGVGLPRLLLTPGDPRHHPRLEHLDDGQWRQARVDLSRYAGLENLRLRFDFSTATIVVDPGHGGPWNTGAVSPGGLVEKEINLDIARRVRDLLSEPHTVDWETGEILSGDAIPPAGWVLLTRVGDGEAADYEAGLFYRSFLANAAKADAMVSIHNNAGWEVRTATPGTDVYYQSQIAESRRFARIMVEELLRSFAPFDADWVGAVESGAKSRLSPREGNLQYYGILRRSILLDDRIIATDPSETRRELFARRFGIAVTDDRCRAVTAVSAVSEPAPLSSFSFAERSSRRECR